MMIDPFYPYHLDPDPPRWVHLASALIVVAEIALCVWLFWRFG